MFLNIEGVIPAVVLLVLHCYLDISVWWSVFALSLWILYLVIWMLILGYVSRCSNTPDRKTVNKNPYSKKDIYTNEN